MSKQVTKIAGKLNIDDRIEICQETETYITKKDHKKGFLNNPSFKLINPSVSDIERISKKDRR